MNLTIQTLTHGVLTLQPVVPTGWLATMRIPGSRHWSAEGNFGTIFFEEFHAGPFILCFCFYRFSEKMTLLCNEDSALVTGKIATKGNWHFSLGKESRMRLREDQFIIYRSNTAQEKIVFEKNKEYRSIEVLCKHEKLEEFISIFPELPDFLNVPVSGKPVFFVKKSGRISPEVMDIIRTISDCPFTGFTRDYYIEHRLEELFFLLLVIASKKDPDESAPTEDETKAAYAAERLILADITRHYSIPAIARQVRLNEFRLKHVFKYIFQLGIFEYLLEARMREARRLLFHSDKPVKEIAWLTGYRLTSFITAFRKHFGYTPGSIRRNT